MASWFGAACRPCSGANPETDTVSVQMVSSANAEGNLLGTDASQEDLAVQLEAERVAREEAEQERQTAEEALRRQEEEQAAAAEAEAAAAAVAAAAEAEERRLRQQQEERMAAEEERRRQDTLAAQREEERERQRQAEEAQRDADLKKINEFLRSKGFAGINSERWSFRKAKYPIHSVVKLNDTELAGLLVKHKADLSMKDSNNQTALSLARKANKGGSHAAMINLLRAA